MLLKTFIIYFAPFLLVAIAAYAAIKQYVASFAALGKKPLLYAIIASVLFSLALFATTYTTENLFVCFWLMALISLIFGIIHPALTHRRFFSHAREATTKLFTAEWLYGIVLLSFSVLLFACMQYFLKDPAFLFYPTLFSLLFFFVPLLVSRTITAALHIPPAHFPTWEYPVLQPPELPAEREGERLYVIGFEIAKKGTDLQRTFFRAKAPEDMLLGDLYYHFINDYNELQSETPIQYMEKGSVQSWVFRTKPRWYQRSRILNAAKTIHDVGIRENTIIICERMETEPATR